MSLDLPTPRLISAWPSSRAASTKPHAWSTSPKRTTPRKRAREHKLWRAQVPAEISWHRALCRNPGGGRLGELLEAMSRAVCEHGRFDTADTPHARTSRIVASGLDRSKTQIA